MFASIPHQEGLFFGHLDDLMKVGRAASTVYGRLLYRLSNYPVLSLEGSIYHYATCEKIAKEIGYSVITVRRAVKKLLEHGYIAIRRCRDAMNGKVNCYRVLDRGEPQKRTELDEILDNLEEAETVDTPSVADQNDQCNILNETNNITSFGSRQLTPFYTKIAEKATGLVQWAASQKQDLPKEQEGSSEMGDKEYFDRMRRGPAGQSLAVLLNASVEKAQGDAAQGKEGFTHGLLPTPQRVVDIFNELVVPKKAGMKEIKKPDYFLTDIKAAMDGPLHNDIEHWRAVCEAVAVSPFIMSSSFALRFSWLLKPSSIVRVQKREMGCKTYSDPYAASKANARALEGVQKASRHLEVCGEGESKKAARSALMKLVGVPIYLSWFADATIDDNMRIIGSSGFKQNYFNRWVSEIYAAGLNL